MEQIQTHEIKDIYRIKEGLIVEIHKYKGIGYNDFSKKSEKRVKGCKGLTVLTEDFTDSYRKKVYSKGTYYYHSQPVEPLKNTALFKAEIKSSGGSVLGSIEEMKAALEDIQTILDKYKNIRD